MLVHGDGDGKSEVSSEKRKQCCTSILSIFQSIKNAEDTVDKLKSKVGDEILNARNVYSFHITSLFFSIHNQRRTHRVVYILSLLFAELAWNL